MGEVAAGPSPEDLLEQLWLVCPAPPPVTARVPVGRPPPGPAPPAAGITHSDHGCQLCRLISNMLVVRCWSHPWKMEGCSTTCHTIASSQATVFDTHYEPGQHPPVAHLLPGCCCC
jgi:hypothetical protein